MNALPRPKPNESFEDMLQAQAAFFQENVRPAAQVINIKKESKVSRFKQMKEEMRRHEQEQGEHNKENKFTNTTNPLPGFIKSDFKNDFTKKEPEIEELIDEPHVAEKIVEREIGIIPPIQRCADAGFPSFRTKTIPRGALAAPRKKDPVTIRRSDPQEMEGVDEDTDNAIQNMNISEVEDFRKNIFANMTPERIAFFQKRGLARTRDQQMEEKIKKAEKDIGTRAGDLKDPDYHPSASSTARPQNIPDRIDRKDEVSQDASTKKENGNGAEKMKKKKKEVLINEEKEIRTYRSELKTEKPYELLINDNERRKMEWMDPIQGNDKISDIARYDFNGKQLDKEEEGTYPALYHHGDDPTRAGYSIVELLHLSHSSNLSQRTTALKILENIILQERDCTKYADLPELLNWLSIQPRRYNSAALAFLRIVGALQGTHPGTTSVCDLIDTIETITEINIPRRIQEETCKDWNAYFLRFVAPQKKSKPFLDPEMILDNIYISDISALPTVDDIENNDVDEVDEILGISERNPEDSEKMALRNGQMEFLLWQLRVLRGVAQQGIRIIDKVPLRDLLKLKDRILREELLRIIRISSVDLYSAKWWLQEQDDVLTLAREVILRSTSSSDTSSATSGREEVLRLWILWIRSGFGIDPDFECFLPELTRQLPDWPPQEQALLIRLITFIVESSKAEDVDNEKEFEHLADPKNCQFLLSESFIQEIMNTMKVTPFTQRPLQRFKNEIAGKFSIKIPELHDDGNKVLVPPSEFKPKDWGIYPGSPMVPRIPDKEWELYLYNAGAEWVWSHISNTVENDETQEAKNEEMNDVQAPHSQDPSHAIQQTDDTQATQFSADIQNDPCVASLYEICVARNTVEAFRASREEGSAHAFAKLHGISFPFELKYFFGACEDWCNPYLAPFITLKECTAVAALTFLDVMHYFKVPQSVIFISMCIVVERFPEEENILNAVDKVLTELPSMPGETHAFPESFHHRLVDIQEILFTRFLNDGVQHPAVLRLLASFGAQWSPEDVRRKFWIADPHFPILLTRCWKSYKLIGQPQEYYESNVKFDEILQPFRNHVSAQKEPLCYMLFEK